MRELARVFVNLSYHGVLPPHTGGYGGGDDDDGGMRRRAAITFGSCDDGMETIPLGESSDDFF